MQFGMKIIENDRSRKIVTDILIRRVNKSIFDEIDLLEKKKTCKSSWFYILLLEDCEILPLLLPVSTDCLQLISLQIKHSHTVGHCGESIMPRYAWVGMDDNLI